MNVQELVTERVAIGSETVGSQAVSKLYRAEETDLAVIIGGIEAGISGSVDSGKRTYYKLSLVDTDQDPIRIITEDLFTDRYVDGGLALCEAVLFIRCLFCLADLGVPFPCTEHGEFMGYKTGHNKGRRAVSTGSYTPRLITECLESTTERQGIRILGGLRVIRLLVRKRRSYGISCLDRNNKMEVSYLII